MQDRRKFAWIQKNRNSIILHGRSESRQRVKRRYKFYHCWYQNRNWLHMICDYHWSQSDLMRKQTHMTEWGRIERGHGPPLFEISKQIQGHTRSAAEDNESNPPLITVMNNRGQNHCCSEGWYYESERMSMLLSMAANGALYHAGGLDKIIADAAGIALTQQCREINW